MNHWRTDRTLDNILCGAMADVAPVEEIEKGMEEASLDSIEEIHVSRLLYEKKKVAKDDSSLEIPFTPLMGESALFLGVTTDGVICLTDYRLFVSVNPFFNIPLGLIEQVEFKENHHLYIQCKHAQTFRCTFSENSDCQKWLSRIQAMIVPNLVLEKCFCFIFFSWSRDEKSLLYRKSLKVQKSVSNSMQAEAIRMGFGSKWKISTINSDYSLCPTYPRYLIVPSSVSDETLRVSASFRHCKRIPVVVWRHMKNGCVIARSSQPKVGFFGSPCKEDEALIQAILDASRNDCNPEQRPVHHDLALLQSDIADGSLRETNQTEQMSKMLVIDARSYAAAFANRAKGGGTEVCYPNCDVVYQNLVNIHGVRRSLQSLRNLCTSISDPSLWLSNLESTRWLSYVSSLINAAVQVVNAVDLDNKDILVHCSDGWDRTPQIVALAELLMDPFYRSKKGFKVLVEKEWIDFGHKFADRCGHIPDSDDLNERSPVFLQWIDCVYQIHNQFETRFEFNEQYLVKLVYHAYSCLFGTFLCNSDQERKVNSVNERTFSVWSHLNENPNFHNHLYEETTEVLRPSYQPNVLKFWNSVYYMTQMLSSGAMESPVCVEPQDDGDVAEESSSLVKTKSYDDITLIAHSSGRQRRSSDTSIIELSGLGKETLSNAEDDVALELSDLDKNGNASVFPESNSERTSTCETGEYSLLNEECKPSVNTNGCLVSEEPRLRATSCEELEPSESGEDKSIFEIISDYFDKRSGSGSCSGADTPHQSRSSSGIPSSPCEEMGSFPLKVSTVPLHILDIDGSVINKDETQLQAWRNIVLRNERIRKLEKEKEIHNLLRRWLLKHRDEFVKWVSDIEGVNGTGSDNETSSLDDPSTDEHEIHSSNGSEDGFVKIERRDVAAAVCTQLGHLQSNYKQPRNCRNKVVCSGCLHYQPVVKGQYQSVSICELCYTQLHHQCRQSVELRDKLPETVITATSN